MKKLFFIIALFLTSASMMYAQQKPVILNPTAVGTGANQGQKHRTPIAIPDVYIDGYALSFDTSCIKSTVMIVDSDGPVVYTTMVDETGTVELPTSLAGVYELRLVRGSITFVGEIEL